MDYYQKYIKYKAKYLKLKSTVIMNGSGLFDRLWSTTQPTQQTQPIKPTQITQTTQTTQTPSCAPLTQQEKNIINLLKQICPTTQQNPEFMQKMITLINQSPIFSPAFKQTSIDFLQKHTLSQQIQKPTNRATILATKKDQIINLNLSSTSSGYEPYDQITIQYPDIKLFKLKKTTIKGDKYAIIIRIIDIHNLQKYGDDPMITQLYDKCQNPKMAFNIITDLETCLTDVQMPTIKPKYVLTIHNIIYYIDKNTNKEGNYINLQYVTQPLNTINGLTGKITIYGSSDKDHYKQYNILLEQNNQLINQQIIKL